jgi:hypothetical protein
MGTAWRVVGCCITVVVLFALSVPSAKAQVVVQAIAETISDSGFGASTGGGANIDGDGYREDSQPRMRWCFRSIDDFDI